MFDTRLKELRKSRKLTQKQVAANVSITERSYQELEYGKAKPSHDTIIALADFFNVSTDYLLGRSDDPERR